MSVKIEAISDIALGIGEGPHWDDRALSLYFVDVIAGTIHKYTTAAGHTKTQLDGPAKASFIIPVEGHLDQFVVGMGTEFLVVQWDGAEGSTVRVLTNLGGIDASLGTAFNDGKADPRGRLYSGTLDQGNILSGKPLQQKGSLYRLDQGGVTELDDKITLSNGLTWDQAAGAMYYIDSIEKKIRRYDYDVETGNISNLNYIFDLKKNNIEGIADGMTIDTDGNLWVAVFGGGCVCQISPGGQILRHLRLPVVQVTSCTFGGADLDILFVTSGCLDTGAGEQKPPSGCTFKISGLSVKGHPNVNVKLQN